MTRRTAEKSFIVHVGKRRTAVRLNSLEIDAIQEIVKIERCFKDELYAHIDQTRPPHMSLTAAIRNFIISYYQEAATEEGHARADHGELIKTRRKHR